MKCIPMIFLSIAAMFFVMAGPASAQTTVFPDDVTVQGKLLVSESDGSGRLVVENTAAGTSTQSLVTLKNNGGIQLVFENTASGTTWVVKHNSNDSFSISQLGTGGSEVLIEQNGAIRLGAGGSSILNIRPDGRVLFSDTSALGVGVASPAEALDIDGNLKLSGNIVSDGDLCLGSGCP